ncbi:methyltransferase domain-containing protein [Fodinibius sediminis]|uniref:2-polyprenyl-3-methyl-5-hydroxy-6-metoxy-1,4-benzoquinol methylase n=1 Tax=Fodinibius sediminis TaxID=1214077 RepID=A0A521CN34_9BACT|nr:methyltransferase domain-containing protein [Fodinibius sediminis]SMO60853.1 2-polyprenyl-3-methyl-5-hydroxy-6-metoxy-1,4-benzoquinol methylase [Fodinibius sediminis]
MDEPDCHPLKLENTYRQFKKINGLLSQWRSIYQKELRPYLQAAGHARLLDIGFGGGDIPLKLATWAAGDKLDLHITAVDTDKRAFDFVSKQSHPDNISFLNCSAEKLAGEGKKYDFVISNHLVHHLSKEQLRTSLSEARELSTHKVIFNDIRRSDLAYLLFSLLTRPLFQDSFIIRDGLTSIERSYTLTELKQTVPKGWQVRKLFPFRLLLTYHHA